MFKGVFEYTYSVLLLWKSIKYIFGSFAAAEETFLRNIYTCALRGCFKNILFLAIKKKAVKTPSQKPTTAEAAEAAETTSAATA